MPTSSIRKLVGAIGLVVSVTTAVSIPCGYFIVAYRNVNENMAFTARLNTAHVAEYIYTHDVMWQYQRDRLSAMLHVPRPGEQQIVQKIFDQDAKLVLEVGPSLTRPLATHSAPIVVAGATVGTLVVQESLWETLYMTGLVALFSALFGFGVYLAVRLLPLRVLDRTLGALQSSRQTLATQNERFEAALTHMSQGLLMFDANGKVVIFNRRVAEIYDVPIEMIKPGMTTPELMAIVSGQGIVADIDPEGTLELRQNIARAGKAGSMIERLTDGRSVTLSYQPMPTGGYVVTFEDITSRLLAEERIKRLAHYDTLTGLPNRMAFYERIDAILGQLRRSESIAVFSLDLDHFKSINDTLGHPIGDLLLQAVAERMSSCVRSEDVVARLGGDEFAIVQVPSEQPADITGLAARLIEVVSAPYMLDGHQVVIGASIGITVAPHDSGEPDVLMKNADLALYRAKADGGSNYRFFEAEMDARMQVRRELELDLRKAIAGDQFELYYQPVIDVKTGEITCCEALIRWHHPERGIVAPLEFIPVAEETGLIVPLGEWVIRQACAEAACWPRHVSVAVNVSPAQFKSRNLVPTVVNALASSGLEAKRLELEITELVLMQESEGAIGVLNQFHELGVTVAMDDFGTGYSSLGYLRSFPFDRIKIDQSFIRDLSTQEDSVAIIRAVVGLSSSLGIRTTAEGVETDEQLLQLKQEGCNDVQGFLFSRPIPATDMMRMLRKAAPLAEAVA